MSVFFFQAEDGIRDYKVTGVQTCALPICPLAVFDLVQLQLHGHLRLAVGVEGHGTGHAVVAYGADGLGHGLPVLGADRKSTRLNSSHLVISYAVFCLKKKTS